MSRRTGRGCRPRGSRRSSACRRTPRRARWAASCLKRLIVRQPSEWIRPRTKSPGCRVTMSCCQSSSAIVRSCLRPGPCCGNACSQSLPQAWTWTHSPLEERTNPGRCFGIVRTIAAQQSSMTRRYRKSSAIRSNTRPRFTDRHPSPRYMPNRYAYDGSWAGTHATSIAGHERRHRPTVFCGTLVVSATSRSEQPRARRARTAARSCSLRATNTCSHPTRTEPDLHRSIKRGTQDSNLQPPVLETGAQPVELVPQALLRVAAPWRSRRRERA